MGILQKSNRTNYPITISRFKFEYGVLEFIYPHRLITRLLMITIIQKSRLVDLY